MQCLKISVKLKTYQIKTYIEKYRSLSEHNIEDDCTLGSITIQEPSDNNKTETISDNKKLKGGNIADWKYSHVFSATDSELLNILSQLKEKLETNHKMVNQANNLHIIVTFSDTKLKNEQNNSS
ncbi:fam-c protein [Plasmodium vinckei lentum]|uniref:Fam-c protein n=1 Tax=Plasmodium vinckei lentum TaxID=138297 RepID=A0A6V7S5N9_PLAVN|nr:fam-c protein [Plasmodium vinckei lentum]